MKTTYEQLILKHPEAEACINQLLVQFGVPQNLKGYRCIVTGLLLFEENPEIFVHLTKGLYPGIANVLDTTASRVERAIRHAVESAWNRGSPEVHYNWFGNSISNKKFKPTNGEFMWVIFNNFKRAMRDMKNIQT